jgi:ketosteroid isomerase-like protein
MPTGHHFEESSAEVRSLQDGKIVRFRQYIDTASLRNQIED